MSSSQTATVVVVAAAVEEAEAGAVVVVEAGPDGVGNDGVSGLELGRAAEGDVESEEVVGVGAGAVGVGAADVGAAAVDVAGFVASWIETLGVAPHLTDGD